MTGIGPGRGIEMSKQLEFIGGLATGAYLLLIVCFVATRFSEFTSLKLNELGDFLAGSFGPIAFLWLVLGFLQQGRELKLSTDALKLQAAELKNSVEQQSIMAAAATQQIESQRQVLQLQISEIERSMSANFQLRVGLKAGGRKLGTIMNRLIMTNNGNIAENVSVVLEPGFDSLIDWNAGTMINGGTSEVELVFVPPSEDLNGTCTVTYSGLDGRERKAYFTYFIEAGDQWIKFGRMS